MTGGLDADTRCRKGGIELNGSGSADVFSGMSTPAQAGRLWHVSSQFTKIRQ